MTFRQIACGVGYGLALIASITEAQAQSAANQAKEPGSKVLALDPVVAQPGQRSNSARIGGRSTTAQSTQRVKPTQEPDVTVLDPIIVEARRRNELARDVPLSTTVLQAKDIGTDRIDTLSRAIDATPNAVFNPQGGPITIRGVSSLGPTGGVDRPQSVGVFLDGVYIARPYGLPRFMDDFGRIEVVRGPQATLYGMNTLGGAINLISTEPADSFKATLEGGLGSHGLGTVKGSFDAPLVPGSLYAHGFLSFGRSNGYVTNDYSGGKVLGGDNFAGKFSILGHIGDATTLRLNFDYSRIRDGGDVVYSPVKDALRLRANYNFPQHRENDIGGVSARLDHAFEAADLTSITALRGFTSDFKLDGDFSPYPLYWQREKQEQKQFSQEFRLSSNTDGPISWMFGGSYMFEDFKAQQQFGLEAMSAFPDRNAFDQASNTLSAFGQLGWKATDRLTFNTGLRYTHVSKDATAETFSPLGFNSFGAPARVSETPSFDNLSPEFSASYNFTQNVMGFARVSRGFLAGGMSQFISTTGQANQYKPETAWTYEAGTKTRWLDDRLELNLTGFYSDISNLQVVQFISPRTRIITNAGASTSYGLELEARAKVTDELTLTAGYGYTHAKFDSFVDPILGVDYSGRDIPFAPRHSVSAGLDWRRAVGGGVTVFAGANYSYKSTYAFTPSSTYRQAAVNLVDARIGIERGPFSISIYGKNLLDERYLSGFFDSRGTAYGSAAPGRTLGVLARARW